MSKKSERISNTIWCRNAITNSGVANEDGKISYDITLIENIIRAMDATLKLDGITGIPANAKVGAK